VSLAKTADARTKAEIVRIKLVLAAGLALIALAVFVVLLHSPSTVAATNGIGPNTELVGTTSSIRVCQAGETVPASTVAIRLSIEATTGPRVSVKAVAASGVVTRGTRGSAWYGSAVTIPVRRVERTVARTTVCVGLGALTGYVALLGAPTRPGTAAVARGARLPGRIGISYLRAGGRSWWSLAGAVIRHMGLGRAPSGSWIVLPIAALAAAAIALASWLLVRELE
jgi:hypothetical protein